MHFQLDCAILVNPLWEFFFFCVFFGGFHSGKFNLGELYERIGFSKEIISRGRFAEMNADQRSFRWGCHSVSSVEFT